MPTRAEEREGASADPKDQAMFDQAATAVEAAIAAGASYADARVVLRRHERLSAQNGELEAVKNTDDLGLGVRALVGSSWGFAATSQLTGSAAGTAGAEATATAKASALVPGAGLQLADVPVTQDRYETPHAEDPFEVPLGDKVDVVVSATRQMHEVEGVMVATAHLTFWDTEKWFVSSQGHRIFQHIVESGCGMDATAVGEAETQRRSYPQSFGHVDRRLRGGPALRPPGQRAPDRRGGRRAALRRRLPVR